MSNQTIPDNDPLDKPSVEDKVKLVVDALTSKPQFIGGSWGKANVLLDHIPLPAVIYVTPVSGDVHNAGPMVLNYPNILLAFVDKLILDSDFDEETEVRNRMILLATEFFKKGSDMGHFQEVKDWHYTVLVDKADVNLCGIVVEIQLKERVGINKICIV